MYLNTVFTVEDRLAFWSAGDDQKKAILGADARGNLPGTPVDTTREPAKDLLPRVFPAGDPEYRFPPTCADDLKAWAKSPAWNAWGFDWMQKPDEQSLHEIAMLGEGFGAVPFRAWTDPCAAGGAYCAHAYFVDCTRADAATGDLTACLQWNRAVGHLFIGTADWIDRHITVGQWWSQLVTDNPLWRGGAAVASGFGWLWHTAVSTGRFVLDPQSVIDDWANASKDSAVQLSSRVLTGLAATGRFDPAAAWFLRWYALSTGIGVMVLGLMTVLSIWRAGVKGETLKTMAGDLFGYLPAGVVLMLFAPMFAGLLVETADTATDRIAQLSGPDTGHMITHLEQFTGRLTAGDLGGGVLVGLLLFVLLTVGALSVFFGLLMHQVALPILAVASGIGFGMWVHPTWRRKAARPPLLFLAVIASKPLLFLLLASITGVLDSALTSEPESQLGSLAQLCLVVVAFLTAGMAPWALLRYAPLLPSRSDAAGFGNTGSLLAGGIGGAGTAMWWTRRGGGSGQGDRDPSRRAGSASGDEAAGDPPWRTAGRGDGKSATEAHLGAALSRGTQSDRPQSAAGQRAGNAALRLGTAVKTAGVVATPVAAQAASGALNKARAGVDQAPGEAEDGGNQ
ncbi:hypothetical protein [Nocardia aurantia]|nr:hypothetical protein [Nocardia aurantia]